MKATERVQGEFNNLVTGFGELRVRILNPTRSQLNKLLGKEDSEEDKELEYVSEKDGVDRVRLTFWLEEQKSKSLYPHTIFLSKEFRLNNVGDKVQIINQMGDTTWCPFVKDGGEITDEVDYSVLPNFFKEFQVFDTKEKIADKTYKKAYRGEEELYVFIKAWLSGANYYPNTPEACAETVLVEDIDKFFSGNVKELSSQINGMWDKQSFVGLFGVETNADDKEKKYQKIFSQAYLPGNFLKFINNGNTFPTTKTKKLWDKFVTKVEDKYGFRAFYKLEPLQEYNAAEDIAHEDEPTSPTEASY